MQYFLDGLANEYERVEVEVDRLSVIGRTANGQKHQLTSSQQKALTDLRLRRIDEFNRRDYESAAGISRNTAQGELNVLADSGVLRRLGDGPARRYRFPQPDLKNPWSGPGRGRPPKWSEETIEKRVPRVHRQQHHLPGRGRVQGERLSPPLPSNAASRRKR